MSADDVGKARAVILMYHRIADLASDPFSLAVSPAHFEEHLQVLRKHYRPIPLKQLVKDIHSGDIKNGSVAITFDDGYSDLIQVVQGLLEYYDVPATSFVVTGQIGSENEFMWDDLDRLLLQPASLPPHIQISAGNESFEWDLGAWADYPENSLFRQINWQFTSGIDPTARHSLYRKLYYPLKYLPEIQRRALLDSIAIWANCSLKGRSSHRTMTADEICQLAMGGLVEIGAHSVTHTPLGELTLNDQRSEIFNSKKSLEELIDGPVVSFSYPYGGPNDFTQLTKNLLRDAGYDSACCTFEHPINTDCDNYALPRFDVKNSSGDEFLSRIRRIFM